MAACLRSLRYGLPPRVPGSGNSVRGSAEGGRLLTRAAAGGYRVQVRKVFVTLFKGGRGKEKRGILRAFQGRFLVVRGREAKVI